MPRSMPDLNRPTSRRRFLQTGAAASGAVLASGLTFGTAFAEDDDDNEASPADTTKDIFNGALTAEQLAVTFYYNGLLASPANFPAVLSSDHIHYFQAALWEEHRHAQLFAAVGGVSLAGPAAKFFFPASSFTDETTFLTVLSALEDAFIAAYMAAVGDWAKRNSRAQRTVPQGYTASQLAKIAAQILGVESEHRTLGRDVGGAAVPNNRILESSLFARVGDASDTSNTAVGALLPFVTGGGMGPTAYPLPSDANVQATATAATIAALANDFPGALAKP